MSVYQQPSHHLGFPICWTVSFFLSLFVFVQFANGKKAPTGPSTASTPFKDTLKGTYFVLSSPNHDCQWVLNAKICFLTFLPANQIWTFKVLCFLSFMIGLPWKSLYFSGSPEQQECRIWFIFDVFLSLFFLLFLLTFISRILSNLNLLLETEITQSKEVRGLAEWTRRNVLNDF